MNMHSGLLLEVRGSSRDNGGQIIQWAQRSRDIQVDLGALLFGRSPIRDENDHQKWRIEHVGGEYFRFVNVLSGRVLDIPGNSTTRNTQVQQWGNNGGASQQFRLEPRTITTAAIVEEADPSTRTREVRREFTTAGNHTFTFNQGFPATVEIYILGAGGGGQGGHSKDYQQGLGTRTERGTGASGGGGAVSYGRIEVTNSTTFNITVGAGGTGGARHHRGVGGSWESGRAGNAGGDTTVRFGVTTLTALGGRGGAVSGAQNVVGGNGGTRAQMPQGMGFFAWASDSGGIGSNGGHNRDLRDSNTGGNAGRIREGNAGNFGGGQGAGGSRAAAAGAGGRGGHGNEAGTNGGNGHVLIIVRY
jgi:hypothetical protein